MLHESRHFIRSKFDDFCTNMNWKSSYQHPLSHHWRIFQLFSRICRTLCPRASKKPIPFPMNLAEKRERWKEWRRWSIFIEQFWHDIQLKSAQITRQCHHDDVAMSVNRKTDELSEKWLRQPTRRNMVDGSQLGNNKESHRRLSEFNSPSKNFSSKKTSQLTSATAPKITMRLELSFITGGGLNFKIKCKNLSERLFNRAANKRMTMSYCWGWENCPRTARMLCRTCNTLVQSVLWLEVILQRFVVIWYVEWAVSGWTN